MIELFYNSKNVQNACTITVYIMATLRLSLLRLLMKLGSTVAVIVRHTMDSTNMKMHLYS